MTTDTTYGRYVIKSMKKGAAWSARAFRGESIAGAMHSGATEEAAILAVQTELDAERRQRRAAWDSEGYPTAGEVRDALDAIKKTAGQLAMLEAHLSAADHILTATELARAGGYDRHSATNIQYGMLGRKLAVELEWTPPQFKGEPVWTFSLATGVDDGRTDESALESGHWRWRLRPQIVEALRDRHRKTSKYSRPACSLK